MMLTVLFRHKPHLEVILNETDFKIIDSEQISNEGLYLYRNIESVEFHKEKTNWIVTVASSIFGLLAESELGSKYKDKPYIKINLKKQTLKLWLIKADVHKAQILKTHLINKLTSSRRALQNIETDRLS